MVFGSRTGLGCACVLLVCVAFGAGRASTVTRAIPGAADEKQGGGGTITAKNAQGCYANVYWTDQDDTIDFNGTVQNGSNDGDWYRATTDGLTGAYWVADRSSQDPYAEGYYESYDMAYFWFETNCDTTMSLISSGNLTNTMTGHQLPSWYTVALTNNTNCTYNVDCGFINGGVREENGLIPMDGQGCYAGDDGDYDMELFTSPHYPVQYSFPMGDGSPTVYTGDFDEFAQGTIMFHVRVLRAGISDDAGTYTTTLTVAFDGGETHDITINLAIGCHTTFGWDGMDDTLDFSGTVQNGSNDGDWWNDTLTGAYGAADRSSQDPYAEGYYESYDAAYLWMETNCDVTMLFISGGNLTNTLTGHQLPTWYTVILTNNTNCTYNVDCGFINGGVREENGTIPMDGQGCYAGDDGDYAMELFTSPHYPNQYSFPMDDGSPTVYTGDFDAFAQGTILFHARVLRSGISDDAGTYTATLSVGDSNPHDVTMSLVIPPVDVPTCSVTPADTAVCPGGRASFTDNTAGGTPPYSYCWRKQSFTGPCLSTTDTLTITDSTMEDDGTYRVVVTDSNDLTDTCFVDLNVWEAPTCVLNCPSRMPSCGSDGNVMTVYTDDSPVPVADYEWTLSGTGWGITGGQGTSMITYTTGDHDTTGTFRVVVTGFNGCKDSCEVTCNCEYSTPVDLAGFRATALERGLLLEWSSSGTSEICAFFIHKSTGGPAGAYFPLNEEPLVGDGLGTRSYSYLDTDVIPGSVYYYKLEGIRSGHGDGVFHGPYPVLTPEREQRCWLGQNSPNPFTPTTGTTIPYSVAEACEVRISVMDAAGRLVKTIVDQAHSGVNSTGWDAKDEDGRSVPDGVYFYRIQAGGFTDEKRMMLVD